MVRLNEIIDIKTIFSKINNECVIILSQLITKNKVRVVMNKMSVLYRFGSIILLVPFFLGGCANETRYDTTKKYSMGKDPNTKTYSAKQSGVKSSSGQDAEKTVSYSQGKSENTKVYSSSPTGEKSRVGQYENATAHYTQKQGGITPPDSNAIKSRASEPTESRTADEQAADLPLVIEVTDVLFEFDKYSIKQDFVPELDRWAEFFQNNPEETAEIYGHTDSVGTPEYNQGLSEKRAQAIVDYLVGKGVAADRLTAKGFGENEPVDKNETKDGRQKNRRVEMKR